MTLFLIFFFSPLVVDYNFATFSHHKEREKGYVGNATVKQQKEQLGLSRTHPRTHTLSLSSPLLLSSLTLSHSPTLSHPYTHSRTSTGTFTYKTRPTSHQIKTKRSESTMNSDLRASLLDLGFNLSQARAAVVAGNTTVESATEWYFSFSLPNCTSTFLFVHNHVQTHIRRTTVIYNCE